MEKENYAEFEIVGMLELCELLAGNGYRLVKTEVIDEDEALKKELAREKRKVEELRLQSAVSNPELVSALKEWRFDKSRDEDVPLYIIMDNLTLLQIALAAPSSMEDLLAVKGFGPTKYEKYGREILEIVAHHMDYFPDVSM